jgi:glycosyltransferase involved in cell wall biosynthesis
MLKVKGRDDIRFLLVGDGASREQLAQQVRREGLDNVLLVGRQPKEKVPAFLSIANVCLVHLKKRDLFATVLPSKIFEAAAMGKPIVLGVAGHAAEVVRRADAGICIEPENETELVAAVERLADDQALGQSLGDAGRQHVLQYYNRDTLAQDYLEVILCVCGLEGPAVSAASRNTG